MDTLELYSARQRAHYTTLASGELGVEERVVKRDLGEVLLRLEELVEQRGRESEQVKEHRELSEAEKSAALALLRDPKLLDRVLALESQQVQPVGGAEATPMNVRFVAATNDDLQARVADGRFRADLYFRLAQYTLKIPPLRERPDDIPFLAARFAWEASVELRRPVLEIQPEAMELLKRQRWPGNVRELRNVVRQAVLKTQELVVRTEVVRALLGGSTPPPRRKSTAPPPTSLREIAARAARTAEHDAICRTLRATNGNKSQAARALSTDYKTLHLKMKAFGIRAKDYMP